VILTKRQIRRSKLDHTAVDLTNVKNVYEPFFLWKSTVERGIRLKEKGVATEVVARSRSRAL